MPPLRGQRHRIANDKVLKTAAHTLHGELFSDSLILSEESREPVTNGTPCDWSPLPCHGSSAQRRALGGSASPQFWNLLSGQIFLRCSSAVVLRARTCLHRFERLISECLTSSGFRFKTFA